MKSEYIDVGCRQAVTLTLLLDGRHREGGSISVDELFYMERYYILGKTNTVYFAYPLYSIHSKMQTNDDLATLIRSLCLRQHYTILPYVISIEIKTSDSKPIEPHSKSNTRQN